MDFSFWQWILFIALAAAVGFTADRASICNVKAVEEILTTRCAYMLACFAKTILWVTGVSIWFVWWLGIAPSPVPGFAFTWPAIVGGLSFGVGAVLNHGCAFSTLTRLGNGNLGMLVTLLGFVTGMALLERFNPLGPTTAVPATMHWIELTIVSASIVGLAATAWMILEIIRLIRTAASGSVWSRVRARRYRLSTSAAVMGLSNGILYALVGTWSYTFTLGKAVSDLVDQPTVIVGDRTMTLLWCLFAALIGGVLLSAIVGRQFRLDWKPASRWRGYLWGGVLMGFGAAAVPGGNDVLLLNAIPGLSPHALPAYGAMLLGIWISLMVVKLRGGQLQVVDCSGDRCR